MLTESGESSLSASHVSVRLTPEIITDSAPLLVVAHFNTSFIRNRASNKPQCSSITDCIGIEVITV